VIEENSKRSASLTKQAKLKAKNTNNEEQSNRGSSVSESSQHKKLEVLPNKIQDEQWAKAKKFTSSHGRLPQEFRAVTDSLIVPSSLYQSSQQVNFDPSQMFSLQAVEHSMRQNMTIPHASFARQTAPSFDLFARGQGPVANNDFSGSSLVNLLHQQAMDGGSALANQLNSTDASLFASLQGHRSQLGGASFAGDPSFDRSSLTASSPYAPMQHGSFAGASLTDRLSSLVGGGASLGNPFNPFQTGVSMNAAPFTDGLNQYNVPGVTTLNNAFLNLEPNPLQEQGHVGTNGNLDQE
jgi:hypothetical protein